MGAKREMMNRGDGGKNEQSPTEILIDWNSVARDTFCVNFLKKLKEWAAHQGNDKTLALVAKTVSWRWVCS